MKELEAHPAAQRENDRTIEYYRKRGIKPVSAYLVELDEVLEQARLSPNSGSPIYGRFRFLKLKTHRFTVYYQQLREGFVYVYAIAHNSRRPGYWLRRAKK